MSPKTKAQIEVIKTEKRTRIIKAAIDLFSTHSYEGTSISQIAKQAGISKGLFYSYFDSKEKLLEALLFDVFELMKSRLDIFDKKSITREDYIKFLNINLDIVEEDPAKWKLYFSLFTQPKVTDLMMTKLMPEMMQYMGLFIDYYTKEGYEDPVAWMRFVAASIDGIQMHYIIDPENFPKNRIRKIVIEQFTK